MSQTIERRIKELERVMAPAETHVIVISFVSPDNLDGVKTELSLASSDRRWTRLADESEEAFMARAKAELEPNKSQILWLSWT